MKDILKVFRRKSKERISPILKLRIKNGENLNFVIPNITCVSDVIEHTLAIKAENEEEQITGVSYIVEIFTPNRTQMFFESESKANKTRKKILDLIEKWWKENG